MKIWPFKRRKSENVVTVSNTNGWLTPMSAASLLNTPIRQKLLSILWQKVSVSQDMFDKLYRQPIERYAELVQKLPASESHHHSHLGGMLDHGLEVISFAAKLRQSYLLPPGAAPEEQSQQSEAWTAAILYGALLHDIGKIAVDLEVETEDSKKWYPWNNKNLFELSKNYRFKYIKERDYHLHPAIGGLLARNLLPKFALDWLAQYPEAFSSLMYFISGHYDRAGTLGEIIQRADQASVANNIGGDINKIQERPQHSLPKQILIALRHLLEQDLKLNAPGADGWLTNDALWLVSKNAADKIRAYLMQQGISVPFPNSSLFDEMQSHKLIIATRDNRAIWHCKIMAEDWTPDINFTLLKFSPNLIWEKTEQRPRTFAGNITPAGSQNPDTADTLTENPIIKSESDNSVLETESIKDKGVYNNITDKNNDDYTFALDLFSTDQSFSPASPVDTKDTKNLGNQQINDTSSKDDVIDEKISESTVEQGKITADNLISWIRNGLATNKLDINSSNAKIHIVKGGVFLASPAIFQLFVVEQLGHKDKATWKALQNNFQHLRIHKKQPGKNGDTGLNIWTCTVARPRKQSEIKGYLVEDTSIFFSDGKMPFDNLYLTLKEVKNEELHNTQEK